MATRTPKQHNLAHNTADPRLSQCEETFKGRRAECSCSKSMAQSFFDLWFTSTFPQAPKRGDAKCIS